jgi:hypothetical protein
MSRLPEHVISSINSYNATTYTGNRVATRFHYIGRLFLDSPLGTFKCEIIITWNANIDAYWREYLNRRVVNLFSDDTTRAGINKLEQLPAWIFGIFGNPGVATGGLSYISTSGSDPNRIRLMLRFDYERERNEGRFINVDFESDRGKRLRTAATFLTAHTMVETMKYLIPAPDTPLQDYLTIDEDGDIINQKGEEFGEYGYNRTNNTYIDRRNDYKLLGGHKRIYSLEFWINHIENIPLRGGTTSEAAVASFTLVNNKRLPLSSGQGAATMTQLKF